MSGEGKVGKGRGRWLAELFMLVNPTPNEKKKKHVVEEGRGGPLFLN